MAGQGISAATNSGLVPGEPQTGPAQFRPRRSHTKSRNGCTQCRRRRIKCDELQPKCTRCQRGGLTCKSGTHNSGDTAAGSSLQQIPFELDTGPVGRAPDTPILGRPCTEFDVPVQLSAEDTELYRHYVQHSGTCIDFGDGGDTMALSLGVPGLAAVCPGLLSSVLALAAACSCCDIMSHPALVPGDHRRVTVLLATADRHHLASLEKIRETIAIKANRCDQTLANALLMALYATSSHRARVWLMDASEAGELEFEVPRHLLPAQPGWISLVHSYQNAYAIIIGMPQQETAGIWPTRSAPWQDGGGSVLDGMDETMALGSSLYATLVVAFRPALAKLKGRVREHARGMTLAETGTCERALDILDDIGREVLSPNPLRSSTGSQHSNQGELLNPASHVSTWLRSYSKQVLGFAPPKHVSTAILGFLCQAPPSFVGLVERVLAAMPQLLSSGIMEIPESRQDAKTSAAEACAMDIFAHWLTLSMLLEDVWWFGEIGEWELDRIVMAVRSGRIPLTYRMDLEEDWLPERILRTHRTLDVTDQ